MASESSKLVGKLPTKSVRVVSDDSLVINTMTITSVYLTSVATGLYRLELYDDEDPNNRSNGSVKARLFHNPLNGRPNALSNKIVILTDGVAVTILPGIQIEANAPSVGTSFTLEVYETDEIAATNFTLTGSGLVIAAGMSVVTLFDKLVTAGNIPDPWLSPVIDCRGCSAISFHSTGSTGTTPPTTIQLYGSVVGTTPANSTDLTLFGQCISPGGSGGPSSIFINNLATGQARSGPRISVSHPYHILRLAGQSAWKSNLFAVLHSGGAGGIG